MGPGVLSSILDSFALSDTYITVNTALGKASPLTLDDPPLLQCVRSGSTACMRVHVMRTMSPVHCAGFKLHFQGDGEAGAIGSSERMDNVTDTQFIMFRALPGNRQ